MTILTLQYPPPFVAGRISHWKFWLFKYHTTWKMWHSNILTVIWSLEEYHTEHLGFSNITHKIKKPFSSLELATNRIFRTGCVLWRQLTQHAYKIYVALFLVCVIFEKPKCSGVIFEKQKCHVWYLKSQNFQCDILPATNNGEYIGVSKFSGEYIVHST